MLPESHLRCGGEFHQKTENTQNFLDPRGSVPINDMSTVIAGNQDGKSDGENHRKKEEEMKMLVSKLEDLKGPPMGVPEYKDAYKVFKNLFQQLFPNVKQNFSHFTLILNFFSEFSKRKT